MRERLDAEVGQCARCLHARIIRTPRSVFWLCGRSRDDPNYARYPRLPMAGCPGFEALAAGQHPPEGPVQE